MTSIPLSFELQAKRLRLRVAIPSDVDLVWSATRVEGFNEGLTWDAPDQKSELSAHTSEALKKWEMGESYEFVSQLLGSTETVGRTGIRLIHSPSEWSIGFWVHPDYWGQGYAAEAGKAVIDFGFANLRASKIMVAHAIWNKQSQRAIEKMGFSFSGENPCGFKKNGLPVPEYEYEIFNPVL